MKTTIFALAFIVASTAHAGDTPSYNADAEKVALTWAVKIPMRDGVKLDATVYRPKDQKKAAPCVFTLTPYIAQSYSDRGIYFAAHGYPYLTIDVRGRGNSEGTFNPMHQEAHDGYDIVEWLAEQDYCNGKIAMWGGSYAGEDQWATAKELPPHLATIVPAAAAQAGVDFPFFANISSTYWAQWLTLVTGHTSQDKLFGNRDYWVAKYKAWFEAGASMRDLEKFTGVPHATYQEIFDYPSQGPHWDAYNPTQEQYAKLSIPILTITGSYDGDQPGAMAYYKQHMQFGHAKAKAQHYLIIGPWDHAGTRTPQKDVGGLHFGDASMVDLPKLHTEWYAWTMQNGKKPEFLKKRVAYYVMASDEWRYADTLEAVTAESRPFYLDSHGDGADSVFDSGWFADAPGHGAADHYIYDPADLSTAAEEVEVDPDALTSQKLIVNAARERELVYHTAPFEKDTELSGFFKLSAWIAIDQPDTDFAATVYEILPDGSSVRLTGDVQRARYRESLRQAKLVNKGEVLQYTFDRFTFTSRMVRKGSRLRLVIGPINSIFSEKNFNGGGAVADETIKDARTVRVQLYHDAQHPSALYVPFGQAPDKKEKKS